MAQLVEHIVHIDGVTGSSPVATTTCLASLLARFCYKEMSGDILMKLIRYRRPSMKTALGITRAKRSFARATGIPTTKSGRKRKAMNALTGGAYGKYQRTRVAVSCTACSVSVVPGKMK